MSQRYNPDNAFDILNQELANFELEKENAENLENLRRRQALTQQQSAEQDQNGFEYEYDGDESEGRGCVGTFFRILLIIMLAAALAWIVFMPEGSLSELLGKISPEIDKASSWVTGLFSGGDDSANPTDNTVSLPSETASETMIENGTQSDSQPADVSSAEQENTSGEDGQETDNSDLLYSITVYRPSQIVIVYDSSGNPAKIFSCSSGKAETPTKLGDYAIRAKYRWRFMIGDCYTQYASSFSNGYLFHSIPYNKKNAATMSNSSYDKLGNPASSGCVRLCFRDTKWIYDNCPVGTQVHVVDEKAPAGSVPEIIPERIKDNAHSGWDPTDDSPDSPYNQ